jgi:hypothetical protein
VSDGAQHKLNVALETALVTETWAQRTASWRGHGASASDGVRGRNVPSGGGCLVAIELASNFILLEGYAADRSAATWTAVLEDACTGVAVEVMQSTADEAKALRRHADYEQGRLERSRIFNLKPMIYGKSNAPARQLVGVMNKASGFLRTWMNKPTIHPIGGILFREIVKVVGLLTHFELLSPLTSTAGWRIRWASFSFSDTRKRI